MTGPKTPSTKATPMRGGNKAMNLGEEVYGRGHHGRILAEMDNGTLTRDQVANPETLSRDEVLELLHRPSVVQGGSSYRLLTMLSEAPDRFLQRRVLAQAASAKGCRKTQLSVIQRLIAAGYVEQGYYVTPLGRRALTFARPLRKNEVNTPKAKVKKR